MMDKAIMGTVLAVCIGGGACLGGLSSANDSHQYHEALKDPGFYHLVNESGDCVSNELIVEGVRHSMRQEVEKP